MIKFRIFRITDEAEVEIDYQPMFGSPYKYKTSRRMYNNHHALYQAAANFATALGSKFLQFSGSAVGSEDNFGEFVVWYRE